MTVRELARLLNRECCLAMIEIDSTNGDLYPRDILCLNKKQDIELIEQIGMTWEIERIETAEFDGDLLYINYRKVDENV